MLGRGRLYCSIVFWQLTVSSSWMSRRRGDLEACAGSDKPEKPLRFNSALSGLLSECASKVFSRRNPSKLNTIVDFQDL